MPGFFDNLLLLTSLYQHRANLFLKRAEEELVPQKLPADINSFLPLPALASIEIYLTDLYGIKHQDLIDWVNTNQTVLRQYNCNWNYDIDELLGYKDHSQHIIATKQPKSPHKISYSAVAFLQGSGNIPPMQIYKEKKEDKDSKTEAYTKEFGYYGFLVEAFGKLTELEGNSLLSFTKQFIKVNMSILGKIKAQSKIEPNELGMGRDGIVFSIGGQRILKIFKSASSYQAVIQSANRLFRSPEMGKMEAMVYDYGVFNPVYNIILYYYIMEKMVPLEHVMNPLTLEKLVDEIVDEAAIIVNSSMWKEQLQESNNVPMVSQEIKEATIQIQTDIIKRRPYLIQAANEEMSKVERKMEQFFPKEQQKIKPPNVLKIKPLQTELTTQSFSINPNWLVQLIEEALWKIATGRVDLHAGNIGATSFGELRFFDSQHWQMPAE